MFKGVIPPKGFVILKKIILFINYFKHSNILSNNVE